MSEPLKLVRVRVKPEWIDEFEHMNVAHYVTVCDLANWAFWNLMNGGSDMAERDGREYVIVETHVNYINELPLGEEIEIATRLLALDDKRYVTFHEVWRSADGALAATNEVKHLGFNLKTRRPEAFAPEVMARLEETLAAHAELPRPEAAGRGVALSRKR